MKPIIISGDILCSKRISGIPRYALEVVSHIEEELGYQKDVLDVRLCYPQSKYINVPELSNIMLVGLDCERRRFGSKVLKDYIKNSNGVWCHLGDGISFNRNGVVCIHDIRAVHYREYDSRSKRMEMSLMKWSAKIMNTTIVTVSEYQKNIINNYFNIPLNRIIVIPNGWEHINSVNPDMSIFDKNPQIHLDDYYYALGSVAKHKNYKWIHEVAKRNPDKEFVVAGNISKSVWGVDDSELKRDNVLFLGYVTDEENKALMMNCRAFVHPSKYEGFGIPPLEALALGKKLIISNATCLPEIYKTSAVYFDPDNYEVDLDELENTSVSGRENVLEQYTWQNAAKKWVEVFKELCEG